METELNTFNLGNAEADSWTDGTTIISGISVHSVVKIESKQETYINPRTDKPYSVITTKYFQEDGNWTESKIFLKEV